MSWLKTFPFPHCQSILRLLKYAKRAKLELDIQDSLELLRLTLACRSLSSMLLRLGSWTGENNFSGMIVHCHLGD